MVGIAQFYNLYSQDQMIKITQDLERTFSMDLNLNGNGFEQVSFSVANGVSLWRNFTYYNRILWRVCFCERISEPSWGYLCLNFPQWRLTLHLLLKVSHGCS